MSRMRSIGCAFCALQMYWIDPMAWAQQSLAINEFKCALSLRLSYVGAMRRQHRASAYD